MDGKYFKLSFYLMDLNFSCPITFLLKENNNNNNNKVQRFSFILEMGKCAWRAVKRHSRISGAWSKVANALERMSINFFCGFICPCQW